MPCLTPYRGDTSQMLLFKIASCLEAGGGGGGTVTAAQIIAALGCTPACEGDVVNSFNGQIGDVVLTLADISTLADGRYVLKAGDTMTGPLNMTAGQSYQYAGANVIRAQTALNNYFFGPSGNLTMTGAFNVSIGASSLIANTSGDFNVALGAFSLSSNTSGTSNVAIGTNSLAANTSGLTNLALGTSSLFSNTVGSNNTALGYQALLSNTSGSNNTVVGYVTGGGITTGSNNTILGANVTGLAAGLSNNIIIADGAGVIRLQIDGSGNASLTGTLSTSGGVTIGGDFQIADSKAIYWSTRSAFRSPADGDITLLNNAETGFTKLQFGGTTSSFPSIKRSTTTLQFRLADDSAFADIATAAIVMSTAAPLSITSGANQRAGNAVLVGGTVTVANTSVTANTIVLLTRKTAGGTIGFAVTYTVIAATSFTITSDNILDTSTYSYLLIEVP